mgnify:FL=1
MTREIKYEPAGEGIILIKDTKGRSHYDVRICFGIAWYELEEDADRAAALTKKQRNCYNGGYYHGVACGRETGWDFTDDDGAKWLGVTF